MKLALCAFLSEISEDVHVGGTLLTRVILACFLETERTGVHLIRHFSPVHFLQRNSLSNVWENEYVHALESNCLSHPGNLKYRHTSEIFWVWFQAAAIKWLITFLLVEDLAFSLCWEKKMKATSVKHDETRHACRHFAVMQEPPSSP